MKRTLLQYIENPMGKGSAAMPNRQLVIQDYSKRVAVLIAKYDFTPVVYFDKGTGSYYLYMKVPSETEQQNTYDVVIKFTPDSDDMKKQSTIGNYNIQLFSNSPSFVYTYAYAYNKEGLLIPELAKEKYSKEVLSQPPKLRNPQQALSYEKSTTFAMLYLMKDRKYLNKLIIDSLAIKYTPKKLLDAIRNDEKIKVQIQREKNRVRREAEEREKKQKRMFTQSKTRRKDIAPPGTKLKLGPKKSNFSGVSSQSSSIKKAVRSNIAKGSKRSGVRRATKSNVKR